VDQNARIIPPGARQEPSRARGLIPLLMALLYGASPIDLIPDLIPLLGWSDDMLVLVIGITWAWKLFRARKAVVRR